MTTLLIQGRKVGPEHPPLVIAEIGINHNGDVSLAREMVDAAEKVGCECVKFQTHVIEDEMIPNDVVPGNADRSIWQIMSDAALSFDEEAQLKTYVERKGMLFLSTPFSRAAADRLESLGVSAYKIGSGECNNYPLVEHIARKGKPVILSTGMNGLESISRSAEILRKHDVPFALLHCTSMYPTPYDRVRLGAMQELQTEFPDAIVGLSDHSDSIYPAVGAVALGASIVERHFTSSKDLPGPDVPISMDPAELGELIRATRIVHAARGGHKEILTEEEPTIRFAYASVVSIRQIEPGEELTEDNIWVKRPGTGEIPAADYEQLLGRRARRSIPPDSQLSYDWLD